MNRISTLTFTFALLLLIAGRSNSQAVYVNSGSSSNYTLYAGDSLYIASGTYTGTISNWQEGAKITVASGANFKPSNFGYFLGRVYVYGTAVLGSLNGQTTSFRLYNYGTITVTGDTYLGGGAILQNNYGATMNFSGAVNTNQSSILNSGSINANADWYSGSNSTITNNNQVTVNGNLQINGSTATNGGLFYTKKKLTLSGATVVNNCRMIADSSIEVSSSTITNSGLFWASNAHHSSTIVNGGTISSTINGKIKSVNFINNGNISGTGFLYFTGTTTNNGTIGKSGVTSDSLKIYDVSRTNNSTIFDNQYGSVYPNARFTVFPAPDTSYAYPACALQYASTIATLPVQWNSFSVSLSNNIPSVAWSSEQEDGTFFEVQRSYNGVDFSPVTIIPAETARIDYYYQDRDVNTQAVVVYYRIKATEPNGAAKFTEIRSLRFSAKPGMSIQVAPNPFTSQFNINYQSDVQTVVTIRLFSMNGQLQLARTVAVNKGFNSIAITEVNALTRGIYTMQVYSNNVMVASEKLVKQ